MKRARPGLERFVAVLQASAAYEERIGQLVNAEEQSAAHPERGKPAVRLLDAPGQGQGGPADVLLGHRLRMVRRFPLAQQLPSSWVPLAAAVRALLRRLCGNVLITAGRLRCQG